VSERYDWVTHSRALLIVRELTYKPASQLHHETGKKENLSIENLKLAHFTWARWLWSWPQQDRISFLIMLAIWSLADFFSILHYGRASCSVHLRISMITIWIESFKLIISSRWLILKLAHHFFFLHYVHVLKIHLTDHYIFVFKTYLSLYDLHSIILTTLKPTYGSSIAYG
jgi:hypothetical protein